MAIRNSIEKGRGENRPVPDERTDEEQQRLRSRILDQLDDAAETLDQLEMLLSEDRDLGATGRRALCCWADSLGKQIQAIQGFL